MRDRGDGGGGGMPGGCGVDCQMDWRMMMTTGNVYVDVVLALVGLFCAVFCTVMGIWQTVDGIRKLVKRS